MAGMSWGKRFLAAATLAWIIAPGSSGMADETDFRIRFGEKMLSPYSISPRAKGLGGGYAAINDGAHGSYQNPASLAGLSGHEFISTVGFDRINEGGRGSTVSTVTVGGAVHLNSLNPDYYPTDSFGNAGYGFRYTHEGAVSSGTNGIDLSGNHFSLGFGRSFAYGRVLAGMGIGYNSVNVNDKDALDRDMHTYELRGGMIMRATETISFGGVISYGNGDLSEEGAEHIDVKGDVNHFELRGGTGIQLNDLTLLAGDLSYQRFERSQENTDGRPRETEVHKILRGSIGAERVVCPEMLTARGGLFLLNDEFYNKNMTDYALGKRNETRAGVAGGVSYYKDNWSVDYNMQLETTGDHGHHVSLLLEF